MSEWFCCPVRQQDGTERRDYWKSRNPSQSPVCSFCLSMRPEDFLRSVEEGCVIFPDQDDGKVYIKLRDYSRSFYLKHLSDEDKVRLKEMIRSSRAVISHQNSRHSLPFLSKAG